jgi:DNA modification methylase
MIDIYQGDCRDVLAMMPSASVNCIVTSPPYFGLRDYGVDGQIGLEETPDGFVAEMTAVFREARRVLRDDGTLWLNLGDSYAGSWGAQGHRESSTNDQRVSRHQISNHPKRATRTGAIRQEGLKPKDLIGIPWRVAFALQADGWYLRQDIIWHKPNPMPESVQDRCTKAHEYIFLFSKSPKYYFDTEAIKEPAVTSEQDLKRAKITGRGTQSSSSAYLGGAQRDKSGGFPQADLANPVRNRRSVWTVSTKPFKEAHFATFPPDLIEPCVLAGCPAGGTVLDPFFGAGTTALVAARTGRNAVGIELSQDYIDIAKRRLGLSSMSEMTNDKGIFG